MDYSGLTPNLCFHATLNSVSERSKIFKTLFHIIFSNCKIKVNYWTVSLHAHSYIYFPSSSAGSVWKSSLPKKEDFFLIRLMFVREARCVPFPRLSAQVGPVLCGAFCTKPCGSQCPLLIFKCRFHFISDISSCIMFSNICTFFYICQIVYFKEIKFPIFFSFFFLSSFGSQSCISFSFLLVILFFKISFFSYCFGMFS